MPYRKKKYGRAKRTKSVRKFDAARYAVHAISRNLLAADRSQEVQRKLADFSGNIAGADGAQTGVLKSIIDKGIMQPLALRRSPWMPGVQRGGYFGSLFGGKAGRFLGSQFGYGDAGEKYGAMMGDMASDRLSGLVRSRFGGSGLYTGRGAYHTNNLIDNGSAGTNSVPNMITSGDETAAVTVQHREYLTDVYAPGVAGGSPVSFQNSVYPLNPGLQISFPFLSQIAQNYDEYEFIQLLYHYRSITTDIGNSTNGQCGTVIMCTNYNATAEPFSDKQQMLEYAHAHDCKLTESMSHGVECDPQKNALGGALFTRSNPIVGQQDLKTYDQGTFQIAIANCPSSYNGFPVGELWVEYTCVLRKPKLFAARGLDIDSDSFLTPGNGGNGGGTITIGQYPFGQGITNSLVQADAKSIYAGQQNSIGCLVMPSTLGNTLNITFPASYTGAITIRLSISPIETVAGTAATVIGVVSNTLSGNVTLISDLYNGVASVNPNPYYNYISKNLAIGDTGGLTYLFIAHLYLRASTQGINNTYGVTFSAGITSKVQSQLVLEQYQSNGLTNASARNQFVNTANKVPISQP